MACNGCSSSGDCACVIVGDGLAITVTGGGGFADPYTVVFDGDAWANSVPETTVDECDPNAYVLAVLSDDTVAKIPVPGRCAVIL